MTDTIHNYASAKNAADGSLVDPNANVAQKNVATLSSELYKGFSIQVNRHLVYQELYKMFGKGVADTYLNQLESHEIYTHDESSLFPYCTSVTLYPYLLNGTRPLGGGSGAPSNLRAFCGSFSNLVFLIAAQFAGAVATVEFLMYFDHFAKLTFGENYLETNEEDIMDCYQQVVYTINEPAAARNYQSVFWNISIFDQYYFESMFGNFYFPDGTVPTYASLDRLQVHFMQWFNKEREKDILTFPVITANILKEDGEPKDKEFADFVSQELSDGNAFFIYMSDTVDSLSSCCRLQNELQDNEFSYTLGAGGVSTGSLNVITINFNRLVQVHGLEFLPTQVDLLHKYQLAYRSLVRNTFLDKSLLSVYDAGFIDMDRQFLTIGINGMLEAAEFLGMDIPSEQYEEFLSTNLALIKTMNKAIKAETGVKFNTEFVPAENLGVKNAKWDRADNLVVPRDCYNSYFYPVESQTTTVIEKFKMHGGATAKSLDGGSALHLNLGELLSKPQYYQLLCIMARTGCPYLGTNTPSAKCNGCGYIHKKPITTCPRCSSKDITLATRVIGYLKEIENFSGPRRSEAGERYYH